MLSNIRGSFLAGASCDKRVQRFMQPLTLGAVWLGASHKAIEKLERLLLSRQ